MADKVNRTALFSVYTKDANFFDFARALADLGWNILGSRGTAVEFLAPRGIPARDIADFVGPPILGHRVVTLSREIHAALLSRDTEEDNRELERIGIPRIDLVCVDLYPLEETIKAGGTYDEVIEKTDIGGSTMLRSAAKGGRIVISCPEDREKVIQWLKDGEPRSANFRRWLAGKAELTVSDYCRISGIHTLTLRE